MHNVPYEPTLPVGRGELSAATLAYLRGDSASLPHADGPARSDPYGDDLQLALYLCYELHYRGFAGVDDEMEWDAALLAFRRTLEDRFLTALREDAPLPVDVDTALAALLVEPVKGDSISHHLRDDGTMWQLREYAVQRSLYHLKEADPHAWVLPRLHGRAKAGMAAVAYDEFGAGRGERVHARLFADLMRDLSLDPGYGRYLEAACPQMLAVVNLMSLLGLHRSLRGALVGHFATVEITSSPSSRRLVQAIERLGAGRAAEHFHREHVEADAVHEQVVRHEVVAGLLEAEPQLAADVTFGIAATGLVEDRFTEHVLGSWRAERSSLRLPL
ncbi:hypothetical protein DMB38_31135 [Streptomyces sp. WAC 06738]|uniref:iron-containing redox enzyme family protein n=1 Tax=Streptomyces sp. WAC 06738 TaxID=2203210 RepID=UPI000F6D7715|nr:iron-containing redox enzyme family protein [Streptomyces sp. WAC 06738]AZM49639.1 hypothetical protein DMB38_31135 [Streptomyces sp. WAC 06738]